MTEVTWGMKVFLFPNGSITILSITIRIEKHETREAQQIS